MIPFSPPRIDQKIIDEVTAALKSGWITTGPRTKQFEKMITAYCGHNTTLCVNSGSSGLELMLRWFGVGEGDEVIVPAYTYTATANVVVHCGAKPVFVDVKDDFNIDPQKVKEAITPATKVIIPVDLAGFPCDYDEINALVESDEIRSMFSPKNRNSSSPISHRSMGLSLQPTALLARRISNSKRPCLRVVIPPRSHPATIG